MKITLKNNFLESCSAGQKYLTDYHKLMRARESKLEILV